MFEADFLPSSYGFRPKRSAEQANEALRAEANRGSNWVLDAGVRDCFDTVNHEWLRKFVRHRVNDGGLLRLLNKWLSAGVMCSAF